MSVETKLSSLNVNSSKPKVLYYSILQFQCRSLELLHEAFQVITLPDPDADTADVLKDIDAVFAPLGFYCGSEKVNACPRLRAIVSNTTGDPHIDVDYAKAKGIPVITLKAEREFLSTITATAEHTWGLLLALTRKLPWAFDSVKHGGWNRRLFPGSAMLSSLSLGVVGFGRLGRMVAKYGRCFGMCVRYYDPYVDSHDDVAIEKVASLRELVMVSDVVSLHVVQTPETIGLISREVFSLFKPGSYIINTSRAEMVDGSALCDALKSRHLAGAALDVFDGEFRKEFDGSIEFYHHPLLEYARTHDNLILTPHIGGSTYDAWGKTEVLTIRRLKEILAK